LWQLSNLFALCDRRRTRKRVSSFPYDVVYDGEVRQFIERNPLSFLRVTRSEAEFPENSNPQVEQFSPKRRKIWNGLLKKKFSPPKPTEPLRLSSGDRNARANRRRRLLFFRRIRTRNDQKARKNASR
jgi:hypothetical protein